MTEKLLSFHGREVSCRVVGFFLDQLEKRKLPPEVLTAGTGTTAEELRDRHGRISWDAFRALSSNFPKVWSDTELAEIGVLLVQSSRLRFFALLTRLFYNAEDVYRTLSELMRSKGYLDFTCIDNSFRVLGRGHVQVDVLLRTGYQPCREFFVVTKGMYVGVPRLVGLPPAEVKMEDIEGGCRYDIRLPDGGGPLRWLRQAITRPFVAAATAHELQEANRLLYLRYGELQAEIAERERMEAALLEREEQYRRLVESSPYSIATLDGEGRLLSLNAAGLAMFGLKSEEEARGRPFLEFVDESHRSHVGQLLDHGHHGGSPSFHFKAVNARLLQTVLVPMGGEEEDPQPLLGMTLDVTQRERAQEEMRSYAREMALLNLLMSQGAESTSVRALLSDVLATCCERLELASGAVYSLIDGGLAAEIRQSTGGSPPDRLAEARKPPFETVFVHGRPVSSREEPRVLAAGDGEDAEVILAPIFWGQRVIGAFRFVARGEDAAGDRMRIVTSAGSQLGAFIVRLQVEQERKTAIRELEEKNAELERFAYTVSHDLTNPLFTLKGYLGFLEKHTESGDIDRIATDLGPMKSAAGKMQQLLDDLLKITRIGRVANTPQRIALTELAEEAVELVAGDVEARRAEVLISRRLPVVEGDRPRILEVFQNLVDNALKFMGDQAEPRIEIGATLSDGFVVCYVRDNGIGIDPRYHEKVFSIFDQLDPETGGTGIGLALVKRIVEEHGGCVWVESEGLGRGSTFFVRIPESLSEPTLSGQRLWSF